MRIHPQLILAGVLLASGCQSVPDIPDQRAGVRPSAPAYRFGTLAKPAGNTDGTLVLLAFSGGGARAAAMAYGVLEALHLTKIGRQNRRSLLSEVDVISGTSGGSFTAAFYGLFRAEMFARGKDGKSLFERRYLKRPVTREVTRKGFLNILRINTRAVNRSDVVAEYYGRTIFNDRTFGDLQRAGRPLIVINAHDTTKDSRFVFLKAQFDLICGDLERYPVSRAVTASSAVHGIFAPIKLRNFSPGGAGCPASPAWVAAALAGEPFGSNVVETPRDRRRLARLARWYRQGERFGRKAQLDTPYYVHLADGGALDNTALWPILRGLGSPVSRWGLQGLIDSGRVKRVLLVVVNAMPTKDRDTDTVAAGPSIVTMVQSAVHGAIKAGSRGAIRTAEAQFQDMRKRYGGKRAGRGVQFYGPVVVELTGIRNPERRRCFRTIKTALDLPVAQIDALRRLSVRMLERDPHYRKFLSAVSGRRTQAINFGAADRSCPPGAKPKAAR